MKAKDLLIGTTLTYEKQPAKVVEIIRNDVKVVRVKLQLTDSWFITVSYKPEQEI